MNTELFQTIFYITGTILSIACTIVNLSKVAGWGWWRVRGLG